MTGWIVNPSSSSGLRGTRRRLRFAITIVSARPQRSLAPKLSATTGCCPAGIVAAAISSPPPRPARLLALGRLLGGVSGEREEHVVERGPVDLEVLELHAGLVEPSHGLREYARAGADRHADRAALALRLPRPVGHRPERLERTIAVGGLTEDDLDALAAVAVLQLVGRALGDHAAVVDHRDLVGQVVGLLEVLRREENGRALPHELGDHVPHRQPRAGVEARGGLVEEEDRRARDERTGEIEAAAHAARVGLREPVAGVGQLEALEELARPVGRPALAQVVEPPDHLEVLEPREVLVDRRVLPGEPDAGAQQRRVTHDVEPADLRSPAVGHEQGGQDADAGGLAGAVRAEQPEHGAVWDRQVDAVERLYLAIGLLQPLREDGCLAYPGHLPRPYSRCNARPRDWRELHLCGILSVVRILGTHPLIAAC